MGYTVSKFEAKDEDQQHFLGLGIDQELLISSQFNSYYADTHVIEKYCGENSINKLKKPPIVSYFEKKKDTDILYSHPDYMHKKEDFDNLANINEYKRIPQDSINKWFENYDFHNAFLQGYIYSIYKSVGKKEKKTYESLISTERKKIEDEIKKIQKDEKLKEKYLVAKMMLSSITSMKLENLTEAVDWASVIARDAGSYLDNSYSLIFLFRYDLYGIYSRVETFLQSPLQEEDKLNLCKIVYSVSIGFKFFHGLLYLASLLDRLHLDNKFYEEIDFSKANARMDVEFLFKETNYMELVGNSEVSSLSVGDGTSGAMSNDYIYIYNPSQGLSKLRQIPCAKSERYTMIKRNPSAFENKHGAIFSYNNSHIIYFNTEKFKSQDNNLFEIYDDVLLEKAEGYSIECDDTVKAILYTKSIEHLKHKINVEGNETDLLYTHKNVGIYYENNYLYIIYPACEKSKDDEHYYAKGHKYACDILFLSHTHKPKTIHISHHNSIIFKGNNQWSNELVLDKMFECPTNNKFIVKSGYLISCEGICIYDILYDTCFSHKDEKAQTRDLFDKVEEIKKSLMISSSRRNEKCYLSRMEGNQILFVHFFEDDRDNQAKSRSCIVKDCLYDCRLVDNQLSHDLQCDFYKIVRNLNEKLAKRKETESQNFLNELFLFHLENPMMGRLGNETEQQIDDGFSTCLLANLAMNANLKLCEYSNGKTQTPLEMSLKFPFIVNLEYPTMNLMTEMIRNYTNEKEINYVRLYSILTLLAKHIRKIRQINFDMKLVFTNEDEVIEVIKLLFKVINCVGKGNNSIEGDIRAVGIAILFEIFSIACLKHEIAEGFLVEILSDILAHINESFASQGNYMILRNFFEFMRFNYSNFEVLLNSKPLHEAFLILLEKLCSDDSKMASAEDFFTKKMIISFKEFFNQLYIYLTVLILKHDKDQPIHSKAHEMLDKINKIIFHQSRDILLKNPNSVCIPNHLTFTLLTFVVSFANINELTNLFMFKYWGVLGEIISLISTVRVSPNDCNEKLTRHDIIIDNLLFGDCEEKTVGFALNECVSNEDKVNQNIQTIYIESMTICNKNSREPIAKITEYDGSKVLAMMYSSDYRKMCSSSSWEIPNVDMNKGIKVTLMAFKDVKPIFKIRIANYKFYDKPIDGVLKPLVNLFNHMLKAISFYENEEVKKKLLNKEELLRLYNTRLFSGGMKAITQTDELNDLQLFQKELKENSQYYYNFVNSIFDHSLDHPTAKDDDDDDQSSIDFDFKTLISKDKDIIPYSKLFSVFDQIMRYDNKNLHVVKGDIPDQLVRSAFFIVIRHERLFDVVNEKVVELFPFGEEKTFNDMQLLDLIKNDQDFNNLFLIWKECSELRKIYRNKKDEMHQLDKTDEEMNEYFATVFEKLGFLYYLNPEEREKKACEKKSSSSALKTVTKNPSDSLNRVILQQEAILNSHQEVSVISRAKEHVTNLIHIVRMDEISLSSMILGFEYMNIKAKFREIAIKIMINVISTINDTEIKVNILSNFYHSFILINADGNVEGNSLGIPTIYSNLNGASAKFGGRVTQIFHEYLSCLLEEINDSKKVNTNFALAVYLNSMIWRVRGRNFPFFVESKFFNNLYRNPLNELVRKANRLLFILPEANSGTNNLEKKFSHFSELRPLDLCHIGKLLTDIFCIYSNLIVKRVVKDSRIQASSSSSSNNNLVREKSAVVNYSDELLNLIFDNFEEDIERIAEIYRMKHFHIDDIDSNNPEYNFPISSDADLDLFNIQYAQKKLYNLLTTFFKITITQDEKIKFVYYKHGLWTKIFSLAVFANEKNLKVIFQLLKLFFCNCDIADMYYFSKKIYENYNEIFCLDKVVKIAFDINNSSDVKGSIYFLFDFLNKIPRRHELFSHLKYIQKFKNRTGELSTVFDIVIDLNKYLLSLPKYSQQITEYIIEQGSTYFLQTLNANLSSLSNVKSVKTNTKLKLATVKANHLFEDKDLDILIKNGYLTDSLHMYKSKQDEEDKEKTHSQQSSGTSTSTSNSSSEPKKDDSEADESELRNVILMKEPATRENLKMNQPNYIMSGDHDIIAVDDNYHALYNDAIISIVLGYLEENLVKKNEYSPNMLVNYIRMIRYLTKIARYDNNEDHKKRIAEFISTHCEFMEKISNWKNDEELQFSLMSSEKLENWLISAVSCNNPEIEVDKVEVMTFEEKASSFKKQDEAANKKKTLGLFRKNPNKIIMCNDDVQNPKLVIPYADCLLLYSSKNAEKYLSSLQNSNVFDVIAIEMERVMKNETYGKILSNYMILLPDSFVEEMGVEEKVIESVAKKEEQKDEEVRKEDDGLSVEPLKQIPKTEDQKKIVKSNWEKFRSFVSTNFNPETCIFLINNKYFSKITKNMMTVGYDSEFFDSTSITPNPVDGNKIITNESLYNLIDAKTAQCQVENAFDLVKSLLPKRKKEKEVQPFDEGKVFELLSQQFDLDDIIVKKDKQEKVDEKSKESVKEFKNALSIKDRALKEKKLFKDIFKTFPSKDSKKSEIDTVRGVGLFLLKQDMRFLHLVSMEQNMTNGFEILSEISLLKLLFYQKFYNRSYFNMKEDAELIHKMLKKILEKVDITIDEEKGEKITKLIIGDEMFDYDLNPLNEKVISSCTQDQFLIQLMNILFDIRDNQISETIDNLIIKVVQQLFNNSITLVKKSKLEDMMIFYSIVQLIFNRMKKDALAIQLLKFMNESVMLHSIFKYVIESFSSKAEKSEFYVYSLEFVVYIINLITKKGIVEQDDIAIQDISLFKNQDIINMIINIDLLDKKFSSTYAKESLIDKIDIVKECRIVKVNIPVKNEVFAISFSSDISTCLEVTPESTENMSNTGLYCIQEIKQDQSLINPQIISKFTKCNEISFPSNRILITNDQSTSFKTEVISNAKEGGGAYDVGKCMHFLKIPNVNEIKKLVHSWSCTIIWCDGNRLYYRGDFDGKSSHSEYSSHDELDKISKNEKIVNMSNSVLLTNKYIYILGNTDISGESVSREIKRIALPAGKTIIGAKYNDGNLVCWTSDAVYAMGYNEYNQISKDSERNYSQLTLLNIPHNLKCIDVAVRYSAFFFLMRDTILDANVVYASGCNKYDGHHCFAANEGQKFFAIVEQLKDKNIVQIGTTYMSFFALSEDKKLYYCGKAEDGRSGEVFEPKEVEFFSSRNMNVVAMTSAYNFSIFKVYNNIEEKHQFYVIGYINNVFPKDIIKSKFPNTAEYTEPALLTLFKPPSEDDKPAVDESKEKLANEKPLKDLNEDICDLVSIEPINNMVFAVIKYFSPAFSTTAFEKKKDTRQKIFIMVIPDKSQNKLSCYILEGTETDKHFSFTIKQSDISAIISSYENSFKDYSIDFDHEISMFSPEMLCKIIDINAMFSNANMFLMEKLSQFVNCIPYSDQLILEKAAAAKSSSIQNVSNRIVTKTNLESKFVTLNVIRAFNAKGKELYKEAFDRSEKEVEKCLKESEERYIEEFLKSKRMFNKIIMQSAKEGNKISMTFEGYVSNKYEKYDQFVLMTSKFHYQIIKEMSKLIMNSAKELVHKVGVQYNTFISKLIVSNIKYLDYSVREEYYNKGLSSIKLTSNMLRVNICRAKALKIKNRNLVDRTGEFSIFSQLYRELKGYHGSAFAFGKARRMFIANLVGERAGDGGGPYRETITNAFEDLQSKCMEMLIPTPNNTSKTGADRDKWTINPSANNELYLSLFKFLGKLLGLIILTENYVPLALPSFIWKQILNVPLDPNDIENIDVQAYNSIIKVLSCPDKYSTELEGLFEVIDMTCMYSNGTIVELVPDGKSIKLNKDNYKKYLELYLQARYSECREQIKALQTGLWEVIPENALRFLNWDDLEVRVCGMAEFDVELLKKNTVYQGYRDTDKTIKFFWEFLEKCTLEERYQYLKFVWGRNRLPKDSSGFFQPHSIGK